MNPTGATPSTAPGQAQELRGARRRGAQVLGAAGVRRRAGRRAEAPRRRGAEVGRCSVSVGLVFGTGGVGVGFNH